MADVRSITQRLDSLPLTGFLCISGPYWALLFKTGLGWAFDAMDVFLFTYLGTATGGSGGWMKELKPTAHEKGLLGSASFAGSLVGAVLFGQLADMYGRKNMFAMTLLVFMLGTLLCATASDVDTMLAFRFIAGIGLGGELPVASVLVQELVPTAVRGRIIVLLESFWSVGCMLAVLLGLELVKVVSWRTVFYLSCIPALWAIVIRFWIPESPKWLASVGRSAEAEAIVEKIECAHGVSPTTGDIKADVAGDSIWSTLSPFQRQLVLFRGEFLVRTVVLWTVWILIAFSYYAIYVWLPTIRGKEKGGFNINGSTWDIFFIVFWQFPGYLSAAYLVEVIGRKNTLVGYLLGSFASALAFGYVENTQWNLRIAGAFMSWFMLGAWGALYAYTPENYPTGIRATGCSTPNAFSRIGAIAGPYVMPLMVEAEWSSPTIMWIAGGIPMLLAATVLLLLGYETHGQDVEVCPRVQAIVKNNAGGDHVAVATPGHDF
ncbi:hypothetical protein H310_07746 [Aphanomyces invadans]|uniref:Major facilitator superfamily (MFS) profile domain-containing protein n=1 Tax=Aphanomyces invadans TaxID=157072 RepID=A0A024U1A2_9STRA|nr:hypothetical protein H310_07746 [Aphanomyces invadans]ETV99681.1 hypothetical protein H310_07746 [Aphanomyces invadans]|eukprot:XP_008871457.1 hypothetical protein H310_07746 [Aphanomyces invadans]